jgi:hypothetical protein
MYTSYDHQLVSHEDAVALEMERTIEAAYVRSLIPGLIKSMLNDHFKSQLVGQARLSGLIPIEQLGIDLYAKLGVTK